MPNYMVALAHFCELHGPSTIMCSQTSSVSAPEEHLLASTAKLQPCASCRLTLPEGAVNLTTKDPEKGRLVYVSTHYPSSQKRYTLLTKLAMKALSVETTSDLSRPVFYGDVVNGYCITKIFKITDFNARGGERKYALMVVADSEPALLQKWDVVGLYLNELISQVQTKVERAREGLHRLELQNGASVVDNERYLRRSMIKPKSLVELTDDAELFVKMHLWAVELLREISG